MPVRRSSALIAGLPFEAHDVAAVELAPSKAFANQTELGRADLPERHVEDGEERHEGKKRNDRRKIREKLSVGINLPLSAAHPHLSIAREGRLRPPVVSRTLDKRAIARARARHRPMPTDAFGPHLRSFAIGAASSGNHSPRPQSSPRRPNQLSPA